MCAREFFCFCFCLEVSRIRNKNEKYFLYVWVGFRYDCKSLNISYLPSTQNQLLFSQHGYRKK